MPKEACPGEGGSGHRSPEMDRVGGFRTGSGEAGREDGQSGWDLGFDLL